MATICASAPLLYYVLYSSYRCEHHRYSLPTVLLQKVAVGERDERFFKPTYLPMEPDWNNKIYKMYHCVQKHLIILIMWSMAASDNVIFVSFMEAVKSLGIISRCKDVISKLQRPIVVIVGICT